MSFKIVPRCSGKVKWTKLPFQLRKRGVNIKFWFCAQKEKTLYVWVWADKVLRAAEVVKMHPTSWRLLFSSLSQSSSLASCPCLWPPSHWLRSLLCSTTSSRSDWTPRSLSPSCVVLLPYALKTSVSHSRYSFSQSARYTFGSDTKTLVWNINCISGRWLVVAVLLSILSFSSWCWRSISGMLSIS